MKILIDTHIFLWFINRSPQLNSSVRELLESDCDVLLSAASLWEIAIKVSVGKLSLKGEFKAFLTEQMKLNEIALLAVEIEHFQLVSTLPFHHRDPFDRLIIAQAMVEDVGLVSVDKVFDLYDVSLITEL